MVLELDNNVQNGFVDEVNALPIIHKCKNLGFNMGFR